jgi:hypothetical protein
MGGIGRNRTFVLYEQNQPLKLPSDLAGVTPATFRRHDSGNLRAALGSACTMIEDSIKKHGVRPERLLGPEARVEDQIRITSPLDGHLLDEQIIGSGF